MTKMPGNPKTDNHVTLLSMDDVYLFNEGTHFHLYDKLGAHLIQHGGTAGVHFALWAPNAQEVSVIGTFNDWEKANTS